MYLRVRITSVCVRICVQSGLGSSITVIFYLISDAHKSSSVLPQIASSSLAFVISHRYCCLVVVDFRVCCC